jgi:hypothetical protein
MDIFKVPDSGTDTMLVDQTSFTVPVPVGTPPATTQSLP